MRILAASPKKITQLLAIKFLGLLNLTLIRLNSINPKKLRHDAAFEKYLNHERL